MCTMASSSTVDPCLAPGWNFHWLSACMAFSSSCSSMPCTVDSIQLVHGIDEQLDENAMRLHGIFVELLVNAMHQLDAIHRAITPNHSIEHYFAFHALAHQGGRILRIHFPQRHWRGNIGRTDSRGLCIHAQLGEI